MKLRNTLILLGVVLGLLAFVYMLEIRESDGPSGKGKKLGERLLLEKEDIYRLELTYADPEYERIVCSRGKWGQWHMEQPLVVRVDQKIMDKMLFSAVNRSIQSTLKEPAELTEYGLDNPRVVAVFHLKDGVSRTLLLGDTVPTGSYVYIKQKSTSDIHLVSASIVGNLTREPLHFRDSQVMEFRRDDAKRIELKRKDGTIVCIKQERDWRIVEPVRAKAKNDEVIDILGKLDSLKTEKFVAEKAERLSEYGLDQPEVEATVTLKDDSTAVLLVGKKLPDSDSSYAKTADEDAIFVMEKEVADELRKELDEIKE